MAWDFSTEPEFQAKLDWIREFVETEVEPLDLAFGSHVVYDKSHPVHREVIRPAPEAGQEPKTCGPAISAPTWAGRATAR